MSAELTPGIIDGSAKHIFKYGSCSALALALHDATGWELIAITDSHNVYDGKAGGGSSMHWCVKRPRDGKLIDIDGAHDPREFLEEYKYEADDEEVGIGTTTREDVLEWYNEGSGCNVSLKVASTFVDAVLKLPDVLFQPPEDKDSDFNDDITFG